MSTGDFSANRFIRNGGHVTFEEHSAQPGDFPQYSAEYARSPQNFAKKYPFWQKFAECFVLRRPIIHISATQRCNTASFKASDLQYYTETGFIPVKNFRIPGLDRGSIPGGRYQLTNCTFRDEGNTFTIIKLTYQQYGPWELVQLNKTVPDPMTGEEL